MPRILLLALVSTCMMCFYTQTLSFTPSPSIQSRMNIVRPVSLLMMSENDSAPEISQQPVVKCPNCDKCDGSGRILGGIPLLLPWWPIKPYRPCPNFIANGGRYSRVGQPLDEIAFGRGNINIDAEDDDF